MLTYVVIFFIGIANSLPLPFMGNTLSIWLTEYGYSKEGIGAFSLLSLPLSFKLLWSPFLTKFTLPFFRKSPRKGWMMCSLLGMGCCFLGISFVDPRENFVLMVFLFSSLYFFLSCLYMVGIAYEYEALDENSYQRGSASFLMGYRLGIFAAGGGALYIAYFFNWHVVFVFLSFVFMIGALIVAFHKEPFKSADILKRNREEISCYNSLLKGFWNEMLVKPCKLFFQKNNWSVIVAIIVTFNCSDNLARAMEGPFLLSIGFDKADLATATNLWGLIATVLGATVTGFFFKRTDLLRSTIVLGAIHAITLVNYAVLAYIGKSFIYLYVTSALDCFTAGMAMTILTCFFWKISDARYMMIQYTLFWSLYSFKERLLVFFGSYLTSYFSWPLFFFLSASTSILLSFVTWLYLVKKKKTSTVFSIN